MTALAVQDTLLSDDPLLEAISPELVLVSPPEAARFARSRSAPPLRPMPAYVPARAQHAAWSGGADNGLLACIATTLGPLLSHSHRATLGSSRSGYPWPRAVAVAQLVEPRVVVPVVAGSSPVRHPFAAGGRYAVRSAP